MDLNELSFQRALRISHSPKKLKSNNISLSHFVLEDKIPLFPAQ